MLSRGFFQALPFTILLRTLLLLLLALAVLAGNPRSHRRLQLLSSRCVLILM